MKQATLLHPFFAVRLPIGELNGWIGFAGISLLLCMFGLLSLQVPIRPKSVSNTRYRSGILRG